MAGLKIMLALVLAVVVLLFFFPMMSDVLERRPDAGLGLVVWLVLFGLASLAVSWALPKRAGS